MSSIKLGESHYYYYLIIARKSDNLMTIKDNGRGMSEEIRSQIFDSSFTTKSVEKKTGTGLSISRHIVEESEGGSLTGPSVLGEGMEFTIALHLK